MHEFNKRVKESEREREIDKCQKLDAVNFSQFL